jgi:hypothetical protein
VLLVFAAPCQLRLLAGPEHGRTIPLAVISRIEVPQRSSLLPHRDMLSLFDILTAQTVGYGRRY